MTRIDDSNTPPGYWFGEIEGRLRDRMRDELRDLGLRRGGWRVLHTLADAPATPAELADRLPHGRGRHEHGRGPRRNDQGDPRFGGRGAHPHGPSRGGRETHESGPEGADASWGHGRTGHTPWSHWAESPHADSGPCGPWSHAPGHPGPRAQHDDHPDHGHHHGSSGYDPRRAEWAFERGFERAYLRGFERGLWYHRGHYPRPPFPGRPFDRRGSLIDRVLSEFIERGWVWFDGDRATLTDEGRAAHDAAFERVRTIREAASAGISAEDYATTMTTLEAMARNLGWTPAGARTESHQEQDAEPSSSKDRPDNHA